MGTTISGDTGITFPDATTQSKAVSQTTPFAVTASATTGAQLNLPEGTNNGAHFVSLKAPDALAADTTFTLPAADGTNGQFLQTNGSGALAFASVAPGGTTGQVQYNNAGAFGGLSSGTSGQVLTSGGAGVAPTWATAAAGGFSNIQVFTSSGTFTVPAGITKVKVTVVGGGGNGGNANGCGVVNAQGGGGGGGGAAIKVISGLTPGGTVSVTVGTAAGTSSFGAYCSATGGNNGSNNGNGGTGGAGSSGDLNMVGGSGGDGGTGAVSTTTGGTSIFGGGGGGSNTGGGKAGGAYGGAGSGAHTSGSATGGAGAAGVVIVEY